MKTSYQYICENQGIAKEVFKRIKPYLSKSNIEQTNKTGWNRSGKKDEVMIGNYGTSDDEIIDNITKLLLASGFNEQDFTVGNIKIWGHEYGTSRSHLSVRVDMNKYNGTPVFFCIGGGSSESYLTKGSDYLTPTGIGISKLNKPLSVDDIIDYVHQNLEKILPKGDAKESVIRFINDILDGIQNTKFATINDFENIENISNIKFDFESNENIDSTTLNTINTTFGEIVSALVLCKSINNTMIFFPDDHSNAIDDYKLFSNETNERNEPNIMGVSVKKKGVSHAPEFQMIANMFLKNGGKEFMAKYLTGEDNEKMNDFIEHILPCFVGNTKFSRAEVVWNLAFNLFDKGNELESDNNLAIKFRELVSMLNINSSTPVKDIQQKCIDLFNNEITYTKYMQTICNPVLSIVHKEGPEDPWDENVKPNRNYSKIMHLLQFMIVHELNKYYKAQLTNITQFALGSIQSYVDIKISKKNPINIIEIKTVKLNKVNGYIFSCAGATWNEWSEHGNIMVRPEK